MSNPTDSLPFAPLAAGQRASALRRGTATASNWNEPHSVISSCSSRQCRIEPVPTTGSRAGPATPAAAGPATLGDRTATAGFGGAAEATGAGDLTSADAPTSATGPRAATPDALGSAVRVPSPGGLGAIRRLVRWGQ